MDSVSKEERSRIMRSVRSTNTAPEVTLRKKLFNRGLRYRLHVKELPGKPDLVIARYQTVIFINGCFWHWHGCYRSRLPKQNRPYWENKISRNVTRDQSNYTMLLDNGWRVLIVWECALQKRYLGAAVDEVIEFLRSPIAYASIEPA